MKKNGLHGILLLALAGLCLLPAWAQAASGALHVGDLRISGCELDWRFAQKMPGAIFHRSVDGVRKKNLRAELEREIEQEALLALEARRLGVKIDLAELDARYMESLKKAGGQARATQVLAKCGLRLNALRASLRRGLEANALVEQRGHLTSEQLNKRARARYQAHKADYTMPASLHLWQAIAKTDPSRIKESRTETLPRSKKMAQRLLAGDSLEQLRKTFSGDDFKDMGWVHEAALEKKYQQKFLHLKVGEVSEPLLSIYGYNVFKLVEKRPPQQLSYEQIEDAIKSKLRQEYREQQRATLLKQARKRYKIKRDLPS